MSDPLSLAASIAGLAAISLHLSKVVYGTTSAIGSVPATTKSLRQELTGLCKALGYLETLFKSTDITLYPQFPADDLRELRNVIMEDFILFEEYLRTCMKIPGDGVLRGWWKGILYGFREADIERLRNSIGAYKLTIDMTMTAANLAISSFTTGRLEESRVLMAELKVEVAACKRIIDRVYEAQVQGRLSKDSTDTLTTVNSKRSQHLSGTRPSSITSKSSNKTVISTLWRSVTNNSTSESIGSYRPASIIDLYCESIISMSDRTVDILSDSNAVSTHPAPRISTASLRGETNSNDLNPPTRARTEEETLASDLTRQESVGSSFMWPEGSEEFDPAKNDLAELRWRPGWPFDEDRLHMMIHRLYVVAENGNFYLTRGASSHGMSPMSVLEFIYSAWRKIAILNPYDSPELPPQ